VQSTVRGCLVSQGRAGRPCVCVSRHISEHGDGDEILATRGFGGSGVDPERSGRTEPGTLIEQQFRVTHLPQPVDRLYGLMVRQHRDRTAALSADLRRIGAVAARASSSDDAVGSALPARTERSAS